MQPLLRQGPAALVVDVEAVGVAGWLSIDEDLERHGRSALGRAHDEIDVTRVEAKGDAPVRAVQDARPALDRPVAGERPLVQPQLIGGGGPGRGSGLAPPDTTPRSIGV